MTVSGTYPQAQMNQYTLLKAPRAITKKKEHRKGI
jgi:hypothetical protein